MGVYNKYSDEIIKKIEEFSDLGLSNYQIAKKLDLSTSGVKRYTTSKKVDDYRLEGKEQIIFENIFLKSENLAYAKKFRKLEKQLLKNDELIEKLNKKIDKLMRGEKFEI